MFQNIIHFTYCTCSEHLYNYQFILNCTLIMATKYSKITKYSNYPIKTLSYISKSEKVYDIDDYYLEKKNGTLVIVCVIRYKKMKCRVYLPTYISKHLKSRRKLDNFFENKFYLEAYKCTHIVNPVPYYVVIFGNFNNSTMFIIPDSNEYKEIELWLDYTHTVFLHKYYPIEAFNIIN